MRNFRFPILVLLAAVFSLLQFSGALLFGVKPDFALVAILALIFFVKNIWEGLFLIALSSFVLKFSPQIPNEIILLFVLEILALLIYKHLPVNKAIANLFLIGISTILTYLLIYSEIILSAIFMKEFFYNLVLGGLLFYFLSRARFLKI